MVGKWLASGWQVVGKWLASGWRTIYNFSLFTQLEIVFCITLKREGVSISRYMGSCFHIPCNMEYNIAHLTPQGGYPPQAPHLR